MREYQAQHDLVSRFAGVSSLNPIPLTEHLEIHEAGRQVISEEIMSNGASQQDLKNLAQANGLAMHGAKDIVHQRVIDHLLSG